MSRDARKAIVLTDEAKQKFQECVAAFAACGFGRFGPEGPAKDTTFAEIEEFGHEVGRMVAQAVDQQLAAQHASHFQGEAPCPTCATLCIPKDAPACRLIQTSDGDVPLHEPVCDCPVCDRAFFPSTHRIED